MRRFTKPLLVGVMTAVVVAGPTGVASASVHADKKKFCEAALEIGTDVTQPSGDATSIPKETAAELEKTFKKLAKLAPTKSLKKAVKTLAQWYGDVADGKDPEDFSADDAEKYGKAIAKFGTYAATKCLTEAIPDIPDLPDITLPGGGKIPGL